MLPIEPGTRVLDLGCGRAMTSIFLAREFGAEVWATDLWIAAEDNEALPTLDGLRRDAAVSSAAMLRADRGKYLGFSRVVATTR